MHPMEQTAQQSILQVDNNLKKLPKLDLLKNKAWFISYEFNNRRKTLGHQNNPYIFFESHKNMR
jgi:hypothetical protein